MKKGQKNFVPLHRLMRLHPICMVIILLPVLLLWSPDAAARTFTVVLDAGHGGKDIGCRGTSVREKDVTLDVAKLLGDKISSTYGDSVKVVYTRSDDSFVSLDKRARIANNANADLFISIHVNSVDARTKGRRNIHGASVYTVGLHKSEANLAVAMRENSVIELEPDMSEVYQDFDPNQSESYIIFELHQNVHMEQSIKMAALAQEALVNHAGRADKGVRQAGFLVLWATRMPAVLVELDFICNPDAEAFLGSKPGREKCADALLKALGNYMNTSLN